MLSRKVAPTTEPQRSKDRLKTVLKSSARTLGVPGSKIISNISSKKIPLGVTIRGVNANDPKTNSSK